MRTSYWPMMPVISDVSPGLSRPDTFTSTSSLTVCALPFLFLCFFLRPGCRRNHVDTIHPLQASRQLVAATPTLTEVMFQVAEFQPQDRKSTRLNSSHVRISYAVFCLKKKT